MANEEVGTGYVLIKPTLDDDAVAAVERKGKKGGKGFAEEFKIAAGVLISDAVKTIASEAVNVFGNAFSNYAGYEQLVGGVEKIFDQANISDIMEDAKNAYKDLNLSANEYLESINQVGATFAQTMGDQKGYDTARTGMKAISDYASGTGRNLEELNAKFALITRATSSYQSIADQFSGILPATSEDFLKQAQAAGFLSDSYTKLTDVPVAEYQEAVSKMLEKGVDDMGLAGNTAMESTKTISGSLAMLSGAWDNFLTGIFDSNADLETLVVQLFDSLGAVINNVFPALANLVSNLFNTLPGIVDNALESIPEIIGPTLENVFGVEIGGKVIDAINGVMSFIKDVVAPTVEWAMGLIIPVVEKIAEAVFDAMPAIQSIIKNVMDDVKTVISGVWPAIEAIVVGAVNIIKFAIQGLDVVIGVVKSIFQTVKEAIENPMESAKNFIEGIIDAIKGLFSFDIQWPYIPLPHFSVSGSPNPLDWLSGGLPSINVEWYAKGGIVDGATLIGAGEAGPEAIVPLSEPNLRPFADAVAERMGAGIVVNEMTVVTPDPEEFMRQLTAFAARTRAQYA